MTADQNNEKPARRRAAHFATTPDGTTPTQRVSGEDLEGGSATPLDSVANLDAPTAVQAPLSSVKHHTARTDRFSKVLDDDAEEQQRFSQDLSGGEELVRHKHRRRKFPLAAKVLIVLLVIILGCTAAMAAYVGSLNKAMSVDDETRQQISEALSGDTETVSNQAFYTLVIGSDARDGLSGSRSDVIILARVDPANARVTLVSIPRDTMINSVSGGVEKINGEYNYGAAATIKAVQQFCGVKISHYVEVNFEGVENVVDQLGGVWVNIPEDITAGNGGKSFSKGEQLLDGESALAYARERYNVSGGDFGRARAQRQIITAIVKQVLASGPTEMPGLISSIASSVSTDLSVADIISWALAFQGAGSDMSIYSAVVPSYSLSQNGVSYVATMYDEWQDMMRRVDAGLDPNDTSTTIPDEQLNNSELGSASNAAGPRENYHELAESAGLTTDDVASAD